MTGSSSSADAARRERPRSRLWRRHVALPSDHGSWVFLLVPLTIGLVAGGRWTTPSSYLVLAGLAVFLVRQPISIAVKILTGRRADHDLPAARFWTLAYGAIAVVLAVGLWLRGFGYVLYLAAPGAVAFAWYLALLARRSERRQLGMELAATAGLALGATAAYWIGVGRPDPRGWLLGGLVWSAMATLIIYAYYCLEQRGLARIPPLADRVRSATPALVAAAASLALVVGLGVAGRVTPWLFVAYAANGAEVVRGLFRPPVGVKPRRIGLRLLVTSLVFTGLFLTAWVHG